MKRAGLLRGHGLEVSDTLLVRYKPSSAQARQKQTRLTQDIVLSTSRPRGSKQGWLTLRFGSTAKVLAKCMLKYYRISECGCLEPILQMNEAGGGLAGQVYGPAWNQKGQAAPDDYMEKLGTFMATAGAQLKMTVAPASNCMLIEIAVHKCTFHKLIPQWTNHAASRNVRPATRYTVWQHNLA